MSPQSLLQATLSLQGDAETGQDELLDRTAALRQELAETDVEAVEMLHGAAAPARSKGLDAASAQLLVTFGAGVLPGLILLLQNFLLRQQNQTLKIKINEVEIEVPRQASPEEIERLLKLVEKTARRMK